MNSTGSLNISSSNQHHSLTIADRVPIGGYVSPPTDNLLLNNLNVVASQQAIKGYADGYTMKIDPSAVISAAPLPALEIPALPSLLKSMGIELCDDGTIVLGRTEANKLVFTPEGKVLWRDLELEAGEDITCALTLCLDHVRNGLKNLLFSPTLMLKSAPVSGSGSVPGPYEQMQQNEQEIKYLKSHNRYSPSATTIETSSTINL